MISHRLFCLVRFDLLEMCMRIFQCLVLQQDFRRGFQHLCRMVIFDRRHTLYGFWNPDQNVVRCKLQQVAVSGYDRNFHPFRLAFAAERS